MRHYLMTLAKKNPSNLVNRLAIGIPVGGLSVCLFAYGDITLFIFVVVGSLLGLREFWKVTGVEHKGTRFPLSYLGYAVAILMLWLIWEDPSGSPGVIVAIMLPVFFIAQLVAKARGAKEFLREVAIIVLGVLYIAGLLSFIFKLRHLEIILVDRGVIDFTIGFFKSGRMMHLTIYPVLAGWGCDTGALFVGKYFGRTKLVPSISPSKTIMGLWGGMIGSATAVTIYSWMIGLIGEIHVWEFILFGAMTAAISQLGDLTMSAIKREASMKDTGHILGAHGGILDRIDGFLFAVPSTYLFFILLLGQGR